MRMMIMMVVRMTMIDRQGSVITPMIMAIMKMTMMTMMVVIITVRNHGDEDAG